MLSIVLFVFCLLQPAIEVNTLQPAENVQTTMTLQADNTAQIQGSDTPVQGAGSIPNSATISVRVSPDRGTIVVQ